jgi:hypothetical protein
MDSDRCETGLFFFVKVSACVDFAGDGLSCLSVHLGSMIERLGFRAGIDCALVFVSWIQEDQCCNVIFFSATM